MPLIGHALEHARASGCTRAVVVIGHEGDQVKLAVEQLKRGKRSEHAILSATSAAPPPRLRWSAARKLS